MDVNGILKEDNESKNDLDLFYIEKEISNQLNRSKVMTYKDFYEIDYEQILNFHKKLIIYNLPEASTDEILQFFHTYLTTLQTEHSLNRNNQRPVVSLEKDSKYNFYYIELSDQEDIKRLILINNIEWRGNSVKIEKLPIFFKRFNTSKGKMLIDCSKDLKNKETGLLSNASNKIFFFNFPQVIKILFCKF